MLTHAGTGRADRRLCHGRLPHRPAARAVRRLASTMAFATLTLARLFHGFNCRADASIFKLGLRSNIYSILAFVAGLVLLNAVLFIPAFHGLFLVADLTLIDIGWIYLLAFIPTVLIQIYKVIKERVK